MYKIEYLVIADKSKTKTKTVKSLKNLMQSDDDIELTEKRFRVNGFEGAYNISTGRTRNDKNEGVYFYLSFSCKSEEEIEAFVNSLKAIRGSLSHFSKQQYVLWDDVSCYYSQKAYGSIHKIENLMRKLLTKFMLLNLGMNWESDHTPVDVTKSIREDNKDFNFLNNIDFIKLSDFLFSENYPKHKEDVIKKLKSAKTIENIDLEEIQALLPQSNWSKFFSEIVDKDGDFIKKRWSQLYDLRNKVAHNKAFSKNDLNEVEKLVDEIQPSLEAAIIKLDELKITKEEASEVIEEVVPEAIGEYDYHVLKFFKYAEKLESLIIELFNISNRSHLTRRESKINVADIIPLLRISKRIRYQIEECLVFKEFIKNNKKHNRRTHESYQKTHEITKIIRYLEGHINNSN